ncbi:poly [ADP-ribose] polymerase 2-like [Haliotis cracherodii]|uniref:poly [ADP-ribose] polymerase 2-like n=1 Tax=Haliotis cracherodii TaxID=6455 RepID=UPI0039ED3437
MGRRSKPAKRSAEGDAPKEAKKARLDEASIKGVCVRWEWEGDGGKWTQYGDNLNISVTNAFNSKKKEYQYKVSSSVTLIAQFGKMVQKNKKTGWERRIRLTMKDADSDDFYVWQWENEHGKWNPYPADTSLLLEQAQRDGTDETVDIEAQHRSYAIDLKTMEQINTTTNVARKVAREKADSIAADNDVDAVDDADEDEEMPSVSSAGDAPAAKSTGKAAAKSTGKTAAKSGGKAGKSGRGKSGRVKEEEEDGEEVPTKSTVRTVVVKGKAPVDPECSMMHKTHVYFDAKDVWDCMLNQTNVGNNNNKYYLIQILEEDGKKAFYVWQRWGRVGYKGQNNLVPCGGDLDKAKNIFCKKFSDKTKNDWASRDSFVKMSGKYDMLTMDYTTGNGKAEDTVDAPGIKKEDSVKVPDCTLDTRLQDLVNLICDIKSMEEAVVEMKYDAKKAPLGKLTENQIKFGYSALKVIEGLINKGDMSRKLTDACNDFYTRIPHNFGMKTPPIIRTKQEVKDKIQLLEALSDIEIAIKMLKEGDMSENPVDRHYHSLKCGLEPLDKGHDDFKLLNEYLQSTHAATHNMYKMQLMDVFTCQKDGEASKFVDHGNRMLLWHGSRLTNWVGILSQGLRIAPPEAPVTGYMFGKGVYFADMSSKSANYCFTSRAKNIGLLLLCEVSLGAMNEILAADYNAASLPAGKHSVKGAGKIAPDPKCHKTMACGTKVPIGKGIDTGTTNPHGYTLNYNEFIVYNTAQIKMRYLLKVKFNYK